MEKLKIIAEPEYKGLRLDKFIAENSELSRSYAAKLCAYGFVNVNGTVSAKKYKIEGGEEIDIKIPDPDAPNAGPEEVPLNIVYEDDDLLVINKQQGLCVHPAPGHEHGTLVNGLMYYMENNLSSINGVLRPGIVHRIDKDTSGLIVVAKNDKAHVKLAEQLKGRKALRKYVALVNGNIKEDSGTVNKPLARNPEDRKKIAVVQGGREAVTHFTVLERFGQYTLAECVLETGRTHQIRVHMASIGHSIVGDPVYGIKKEKFNLNGQLLHAKTIGFTHPSTGEEMEFTSELPDYFERVLESLRK